MNAYNKTFFNMKQLKFITLVLIITCRVNAQNVGIGTTTPTYPLTVVPDGNGNGIVQSSQGQIGFNTSATWGGILKTLSSIPLGFSTNNSSTPMMIFSTDRNVGIGLGVNLPTYKLDIVGRMRLQHNISNNQTAGIWFDGTTIETRSFIGTINDDHVGIWGDGGAGWNIAMNVENGNTGIGTSAPTAKLDINGSLRLRSGGPKAGSVLISTDANGNADWQDPVAFHASGTGIDSFAIPANTWTKFIFSNFTEYNSGLHYQPVASQFVAPVKGFYHFTAQADLAFTNTTNQGIALKRSRYGAISNIAYKMLNHGGVSVSGTLYNNKEGTGMEISTEVLLEAGDIIWLEVYHGTATYTYSYTGSHWFAGNLVTRL